MVSNLNKNASLKKWIWGQRKKALSLIQTVYVKHEINFSVSLIKIYKKNQPLS